MLCYEQGTKESCKTPKTQRIRAVPPVSNQAIIQSIAITII